MAATTTSMTASIASVTPTPTPSQGAGGAGGPSSPLLFFVALGFGVVFTNLWIIVGVKYCFRYNQRNRARLAGEDPDAVDLAAMPQRRRRREKKLMSMEEVNDQFPLTKYKTWRSTRAEEGLPTAGGINAAPSRPASVKNLARAEEDDGTKSTKTEMLAEKISPSEPSSPVTTRHDRTPASEAQDNTKPATETPVVDHTRVDDEKDEATADQIQTAIPAEQLPDPGDACAICIDALEDDDDIRGLTCGHAFHGSCVDPWLTSRRACCPLCKADYYVPKARPEGELEDLQRRRTQEQQMPTHVFLVGRRGRGPPLFARRFFGQPQPGQNANTTVNQSPQEQSVAVADSSPEIQQSQSTWRSRINLPRLPAISRIRQGASSQPGQNPASPAQLEAGQGR